MHVHGSAPEEIRQRVTSVRGFKRRRVDELPRRHRLENGHVVVAVGRQKPVTSGPDTRAVGRGR